MSTPGKKPFDEARHHVEVARKHSSKIQYLYDSRITSIQPPDDFEDVLYNVSNRLRSALDYCAAAIQHRFGNPGKHAYFPLRMEKYSQADFDREIDKCLPGVRARRPDIIQRIITFQPQFIASPLAGTVFGPLSRSCPAMLREINNTAKHNRLVYADITTHSSAKSGGVRFTDTASITNVIVDSVKVDFSGATIQPGIELFSIKRLVIEGTDVPVKELMNGWLSDVGKWIDELEAML